MTLRAQFAPRRQAGETVFAEQMAISDYMRGLREKVGTELLLMPSATAVVLDEQRRILLVRYAVRDMWGLPGGALDPGETPADCAVRETWEETGLYVRPQRLTGVYGGPGFRHRYQNGDEVEYVMSVFECGLISGGLRPDGEEIREARFFELDEIDRLTLAPWLPPVLRDVLDGRSFVPPTWKPPAE